jgi:DNA polymerase kappa
VLTVVCTVMSMQKHKPMAVGGIGMVSTANYVARRYGVRSAMPGFIGRRLCPELVFVRPGEII